MNYRKFIPVILFILSCNINISSQPWVLTQIPETPEKFLEEIISLPGNFGLTFSSHGAYYASGDGYIMYAGYENGKWNTPVKVELTGNLRAGDPFFDPNEERLYFWAIRPNFDGTIPVFQGFSVYYSEKSDSGWAKPLSPGGIELRGGYPYKVKKKLFFFSRRNGNREICYGNLKKGIPGKIFYLNESVNSPYDEYDCYVSPNEDFIIFTSERPGGYGSGDLYISYREKGDFQAPLNLGEFINTEENEFCPLISPDGKTFFFTRGGENGGIYHVSVEEVIHNAGKSLPPKTDTTLLPPGPGKLLLENDTAYAAYSVDIPPSFPGGRDALLSTLSASVIVPKDSGEKKGTVIVRVYIEKDGSVSRTEIIRELDPPFDMAARNAAVQLDGWSPGKHSGKTVITYFEIPVRFR